MILKDMGKLGHYLTTTKHNKAQTMCIILRTWWRHQMETFSALLAICAGNSPISGEFPTQRPVTRSFDVFFDLCLNKRLSKQSRGWWFETLSRPLSRHCNEVMMYFESMQSDTWFLYWKDQDQEFQLTETSSWWNCHCFGISIWLFQWHILYYTVPVVMTLPKDRRVARRMCKHWSVAANSICLYWSDCLGFHE